MTLFSKSFCGKRRKRRRKNGKRRKRGKKGNKEQNVKRH
jgi:hypothetical protein